MHKLEVGPITLLARSTAGIGTGFVLPRQQMAFDLGVMSSAVVGCRNVFLSHGHTDHAGEILNFLAIRCLESRDLATIYVPPSLGDPLMELLNAWSSLSRTRFEFRIVKVNPMASIILGGKLSVTAHALAHSPDTLGYTLVESVEKIMPEFRQLPSGDIQRLRAERPNEAFFKEERPLFTYIPDTLPEGIDALPDSALSARVVAVECTFLDDRKPIEKVRAGKHVIIHDIVERLDRFQCEHLVLFHISRLYKPEEALALARAALPDHWKDRFTLIPPEHT